MNEQELQALVAPVVEAIRNEGRDRHHHRDVMKRHRREWPTLWRALDEMVKQYPKKPSG